MTSITITLDTSDMERTYDITEAVRGILGLTSEQSIVRTNATDDIPTPSRALEAKIEEVEREVQAEQTFWSTTGDEALILGAGQIHKVYEDNGYVYVLATQSPNFDWEDVTLSRAFDNTMMLPTSSRTAGF